jgi:DNA-binding transcriptional LysR family regulator
MMLAEKPSGIAPAFTGASLAPAKAPTLPTAESWLNDMHHFVAVAQLKSFTRAAHQLGIPHSTLSRRISRLEKILGFRLFTRTTRQVELTEEGLEYFDRAEPIVAEALAIHEDLSYRKGKPSGVLRISLPECIALQVATPWIAEFAALHPEVALQVDTASEHADIMRDGFDICITHLTVEDASCVRRTLASFKRMLFASPDYAQRHGLPTHPEQLVDHQCICIPQGRSTATIWTLWQGDRKVCVPVTGNVTTVNQNLAPELAKEGAGIAAGMPGPLKHYLDSGALIPVLEDWELEPLVVSVVMPDRMVAARTRAFVEFFSRKYKAIYGQLTDESD